MTNHHQAESRLMTHPEKGQPICRVSRSTGFDDCWMPTTVYAVGCPSSFSLPLPRLALKRAGFLLAAKWTADVYEKSHAQAVLSPRPSAPCNGELSNHPAAAPLLAYNYKCMISSYLLKRALRLAFAIILTPLLLANDGVTFSPSSERSKSEHFNFCQIPN